MKRLLLLLLSVFSLSAHADLKVFATVPEWGALTKEIGGRHVDVFTATGGLQDPHHVEAKPSLIARARNADLIVATGAELEVGWLPVVMRNSGNPRIQPGQPGYFEAAPNIRMLEVPTRLDRSDGDVHAGGNPHIQTDPRNYLKIGEALAIRLGQLDAANASEYQANFRTFAERWKSAIAKWEVMAAPLRGVHVVTQHKAFPYLYDWLGIVEAGTLEPKPGVEPSVSYLGEVLASVETKKPRMVIRAAWNSPRPAEWFSEHAHVPQVILPFTVGGDDQATDLFGLFDDTVAQLLKANKWNELDWSLLAAPFAAGLLVLATHVPLGREVLKRGIIFIDLAIAQVAGLGVMLAQMLEWSHGENSIDPATQITAAIAACVGAILLTWSGKRWPEIQEALIGLLFVFAASAGILLLAHNPHGGEHLKDMLAGQILWVNWSQLALPAVIYVLVLAIWFGLRQRLGDGGFYLLFALTVTFSVQLVGVFLVFASLIAPALASRHRDGWRGLGFAYAIGAVGYALGLAASAWWDLPSGAAIACALCVMSAAGLRHMPGGAGNIEVRKS